MVRSKFSVLALLIILVILSSCSTNAAPQFGVNETSSMSSFPEGQEVYLSERATMKLGKTFIWVSKNSGPYLPHRKPANNSCLEISFELTSPFDNSTAQVPVIICQRAGKMYYQVPINF